MTFTPIDPRFEAHAATPLAADATPAELAEYLEHRYAIEPVRNNAFTELIADILNTSVAAADFQLRQAPSDKFKLVTLFSRLAHAPRQGKDSIPAPPGDDVWDRPVPNKRWHTHIRGDYQYDADGELVNQHASVSNFPSGDSDIPQKIDSDHRINYFFWSLWEGLSDGDKAAYPHLAYERREERPLGTGLGAAFVRLLLEAERHLRDSLAAVEARDPRQMVGTLLPHVFTQEHVDIVNYHVDQLVFHAGRERPRQETLRPELIKHAALNMAGNELDGIEELDKQARAHLPLCLSAVLDLDGDAPWDDGAAGHVLDALAADFGIERKAMHPDTIALAHRLATIYVDTRRPRLAGADRHFDRAHLSVRAHALHAALVVHDAVHRPGVPRQVAGDTAGKVSALLGLRKHLASGAAHPLTESHYKFYLNRYAALHYAITPGCTLEEGIASYYRVRQARRLAVHRFFGECRDLDSAAIARIVPLLAPARLLDASPRAMPGARFDYRL